jgi:hypothetical protein
MWQTLARSVSTGNDFAGSLTLARFVFIFKGTILRQAEELLPNNVADPMPSYLITEK